MEIELQTKIYNILEKYPELENILVELALEFAKLKNPILRRTIARVTSVQQAANVAKISPEFMLMALRRAAGSGTNALEDFRLQVEEIKLKKESYLNEIQPEWFSEDKIKIRFDANYIIESGGSPLSDILHVSKQLNKNDILEITTPFRPEPIIDIFKSKGFLVWYNNNKTYFYNL